MPIITSGVGTPLITLDDAAGVAVTLHETTTRAVVRANGLTGIGAPRTSKRPRPQAHGGINETRWEGERIVTLEGEVWSPGSQADAFAEFHAITKPMLDTWDTGAALLKWTEGDGGLSYQRSVKLDGEVLPVWEEGGAYLSYQAEFCADDPRAYSQTLQTVTGDTLSTAGGGALFPAPFPILFIAAGAGSAVCVNAGNSSTPPIFRVYGYCTAPTVQISATERIVLTGEIGLGDFIELDVANRTVKLNGATNRRNMLDSAQSSWFDLPADSTTTVQLLSSVFDTNARVDVVFRSAYR